MVTLGSGPALKGIVRKAAWDHPNVDRLEVLVTHSDYKGLGAPGTVVTIPRHSIKVIA